MTATCPTDDALAAVLDGACPRPAEWDEHIQECECCQARLDALTRPAAPAGRGPTGSAEWERLRTWMTAHPPAFDAPAGDAPDIPGFEIEAELGRGVSGVVYAARELALARRVAIKLFPPLAAGTDARVRFQQETAYLARLNHPNVVQVYRVGEVEGRPYLVMEFAEGASLAARAAGAPWPAKRAAGVVCTLAQASEYAHQRGIVHRDLKPDNVLVVEGDVLKIADFGLAITRQLTLDAQAGFATGTPGYAAPEQLAGLDPRAANAPAVDIYGLGAILYELLAGRPPFRAARPLDTLYQTIHEPPIPPSRLEPRTPRDLEVICLKCLEKEPAKRYPTAGRLADDLRRFLVGEPIQARPCSPVERAGMWARRHPVGTLGLALIAALLAASGVMVVWLWQAAERSLVVERAAKEEAQRRTELEQAHARESQRRNSELLLDQAIHLCEQGEVEAGLKAFTDLRKGLTDRDDDLLSLLRRSRNSWRYRHVLESHRIPQPAPVVAVDTDPRGTRFAVATVAACRLWNLATGEPVGDELTYDDATVAGVRWDRDGDGVVVWGGNGARLWAADGRPLGHVFPKAAVTAVADLGGGGWAVAADRNWVVWDRPAGRGRFAPRELKAAVRAVGPAPGGRHLLLGLADGTLVRCDPATGAEVETAAAPLGPAARAVISGSGAAAVADDEQIQLFRTADGLSASHLLKPRARVGAIALAGDAPRLAAFIRSATAPAGQLLVWDSTTGVRENTIVCDGPLTELHVSRDGDRILAGGPLRRASVWLGAVDRAAELRLGFTPVNAAVLSADGRYAVVGRGAAKEPSNPVRPFAQVWKLPDDQRRGPPVPLSGVTALAPSADGRLAAGDREGVVRIVEPTGRDAARVLADAGAPVRALAFHPAGQFLLAVADRAIHVLDPATGSPLRPPLQFAVPVRSFALSGDGRHLVVGGRLKQYSVWETAGWTPVGPAVTGKQYLGYVGFMADEKTVLAGTLTGGVELRDLRTGELRGTYQLPTMLNAAALSPDGRHLAVGSNRRALSLVEAATGREVRKPYLMPDTVDRVCWHPDGNTLFARTTDGLVRHIDAGTMRPIGPPLLTRATDLAVTADGGTLWSADARGLTPWVVPGP